MKILSVLSLFPLLFSLSACSGEEASMGGEGGASVESASEARLDSCSLLKSDEVAAAFGTAFEEGRLEEHGTAPDENYFSICLFHAANESALPAVSLMANRAPSITNPAASLQAQIDDMRENAMPDYQLEAVSELGEGAGWDPMMGELIVFRPGLMMTMGATGTDDALGQLVELTKTALERVPEGR